MNRALRLGVLGVVAWVMVAVPAAVPAYASSMPQLDFANPLLIAQVVWGALIFGAFYVLLATWGLPKVGAILEMRANTIASDLEQARVSKAQADHAVAELTEARRVAHTQSQAAVAEALARAKAEAAIQSETLAARLDAQLAEAEARIAADRTRALGSLQDVATDTAAAIVTRLSGLSPQKKKLRQAVNQAMDDRGMAHAD